MVTKAGSYHVPVLLKQSVDGLNIKPGGIYVDVTFGGGGHSREILSRLNGTGHLYSFDQDADAEGNIIVSQEPVESDGQQIDNIGGEASTSNAQLQAPANFTFVRSNFRYLKNWMRYYGVDHIDGLLGDLGVSSHHFDDETRGFSFRFDAPLDMRMNKRAGQTAADIVNNYDAEKLAYVFYFYGELKSSRRIASAILAARAEHPILTTQDFVSAVEPVFHRDRKKKDMAKLFQALRIEVNQEMSALKEMLNASERLLGEGGRLCIITYHSLEDRIVKNVMKSGNSEGKVEQDFFGRSQSPFQLINNKVIIPDEVELKNNPRSRSAKLRIAEKK